METVHVSVCSKACSIYSTVVIFYKNVQSINQEGFVIGLVSSLN